MGGGKGPSAGGATATAAGAHARPQQRHAVLSGSIQTTNPRVDERAPSSKKEHAGVTEGTTGAAPRLPRHVALLSHLVLAF